MNSEDIRIKNLENQIGLNVPRSNSMSSNFRTCPECGLLHPALKPGEKCPNAPMKTSGGKKVDLSKFFKDLKNICSSQIETKKIEDPDRMFKKITIEIAKFLENYSE